MKLFLLSLFAIFNSFLFSECFDLSLSNCSGNCEWVEDVETGYCGNHNSSGSCPNYPACSWSCQGGWYLGECVGWYACTGGYYEIDNSYCEEIEYQLGDINQDYIINIQDIVLVVNLILNNEYNNLSDLNSDNTIDVLDVVQLINLVLNDE